MYWFWNTGAIHLKSQKVRTYIARTGRSRSLARSGMKRKKWTLSFDPGLKAFLMKTAKRRRIRPVTLLEEIVKEKFNPYGYTDVKDSVAYVAMLRRRSRGRPDKSFLKEIREWQRSASL